LGTDFPQLSRIYLNDFSELNEHIRGQLHIEYISVANEQAVNLKQYLV
jgi:hypothetical protein